VKNRLAILVPAFNGGELLLQTVLSCARAGLDAARYELLVVDNCSDDGSINALPSQLPDGAAVQVHRNEANLGRVGNWNRALQIASEQGFAYAVFLFVGDEWLPGGSIALMLDAMDESGSILGMASLLLVNEEGESIRPGARISIQGRTLQASTRELLQQSIATGRLPFAPIQANVYRLLKEKPLCFEEASEQSLNTDIESTALFLEEHPGSVMIVSSPFLIWRERRGRFFNLQDPWFVFIETRRSLQRLSAATGIGVNWKSANAVAMLTALHEISTAIPLRQRLAFQFRVFRYLVADGAGLSLPIMIRFVAKKLVPAAATSCSRATGNLRRNRLSFSP